MPEHPDPFPTCAVCGRTILKGEQVTTTSTRRASGSACASLAARAPRRPAGSRPSWPAPPGGAPEPARPGDALRKRLERAASRARSSARGLREGAARWKRPAEPRSRRRPPREPERSRERPQPPRRSHAPATAPASEAPAEAPAGHGGGAGSPSRAPRPRGAHAAGGRALQRERRAAQGRRPDPLAGRAARGGPRRRRAASWRSSPSPGSSPGTSGRSSQRRWRAVREVGKGDEVSELPDEARAWNAAVDEDGKLRLVDGSASQAVRQGARALSRAGRQRRRRRPGQPGPGGHRRGRRDARRRDPRGARRDDRRGHQQRRRVPGAAARDRARPGARRRPRSSWSATRS